MAVEFKVLVCRLKVHSASQLDVLIGQPGIVCAGVAGDQGEASVLLLWDEGESNHGCSLTNCIETVLASLNANWGSEFGWESCIVVERDSFGGFDMVQVHGGNPIRFGGWAPAKWPGCEPRSWRAVESLLGDKARKAREAIQRLVPVCDA